ncbi:hypothetical protein EJ08DRAFT_451108 [Tothia fuscella]|uniref:Serine protease n=1 Tax=Tothia fuscella TaxID=1048955 RepID=A0A9P4NJD5_9PEZI|nr:hypothetical protein EJ08DRAFT_451108 [Tothia fuscella]
MFRRQKKVCFHSIQFRFLFSCPLLVTVQLIMFSESFEGSQIRNVFFVPRMQLFHSIKISKCGKSSLSMLHFFHTIEFILLLHVESFPLVLGFHNFFHETAQTYYSSTTKQENMKYVKKGTRKAGEAVGIIRKDDDALHVPKNAKKQGSVKPNRKSPTKAPAKKRGGKAKKNDQPPTVAGPSTLPQRGNVDTSTWPPTAGDSGYEPLEEHLYAVSVQFCAIAYDFNQKDRTLNWFKGSGIVVQTNKKFSLILTNRHVVEAVAADIGIGHVWNGSKFASFTVESVSSQFDLALVKTSVRFEAVAVISERDALTVDEPVLTFGFPQGRGMDGRMEYGHYAGKGPVEGRYYNANLFNKDGSEYYIKYRALYPEAFTLDSPGGASGSAVLDMSGLVVGLIFGMDLDDSTSMALSAKHVRRFLESRGVDNGVGGHDDDIDDDGFDSGKSVKVATPKEYTTRDGKKVRVQKVKPRPRRSYPEEDPSRRKKSGAKSEGDRPGTSGTVNSEDFFAKYSGHTKREQQKRDRPLGNDFPLNTALPIGRAPAPDPIQVDSPAPLDKGKAKATKADRRDPSYNPPNRVPSPLPDNANPLQQQQQRRKQQRRQEELFRRRRPGREDDPFPTPSNGGGATVIRTKEGIIRDAMRRRPNPRYPSKPNGYNPLKDSPTPASRDQLGQRRASSVSPKSIGRPSPVPKQGLHRRKRLEDLRAARKAAGGSNSSSLKSPSNRTGSGSSSSLRRSPCTQGRNSAGLSGALNNMGLNSHRPSPPKGARVDSSGRFTRRPLPGANILPDNSHMQQILDEMRDSLTHSRAIDAIDQQEEQPTAPVDHSPPFGQRISWTTSPSPWEVERQDSSPPSAMPPPPKTYGYGAVRGRHPGRNAQMGANIPWGPEEYMEMMEMERVMDGGMDVDMDMDIGSTVGQPPTATTPAFENRCSSGGRRIIEPRGLDTEERQILDRHYPIEESMGTRPQFSHSQEPLLPQPPRQSPQRQGAVRGRGQGPRYGRGGRTYANIPLPVDPADIVDGTHNARQSPPRRNTPGAGRPQSGRSDRVPVLRPQRRRDRIRKLLDGKELGFVGRFPRLP